MISTEAPQGLFTTTSCTSRLSSLEKCIMITYVNDTVSLGLMLTEDELAYRQEILNKTAKSHL